MSSEREMLEAMRAVLCSEEAACKMLRDRFNVPHVLSRMDDAQARMDDYSVLASTLSEAIDKIRRMLEGSA